ncbi:glycosyltransferase family 2 protein [Crocinitomicaceae bacterium]|nr:glycosyltransferase family 2 protein [Crocinitomicaceae bacterium]
MKDIAIVILNWNGKELLEKFLPNIIAYSGDARIILADNASKDDSILLVKKNFPKIQILRNEVNGGFAKGYNYALKQIDAKYYLLLNNDVEVTENWLSPLLDAMNNEKVAGCQPKVLAYNNRDSFEHAGAVGGYIDNNYYPFCRGRIFSEVEKDNGQYDSEVDVFWTTGACMLIRSELFHKANGFDEDFFAHMEEIDMCWRIKKWGYTFKAIPSSTVYHLGGGTLPYSSPRKVYLNFRNNLLMIAKNHEGFWAPKLYYRMLLDLIAALLFLLKGQFKSFAALVKAHVYVHTHIRYTLKKRKAIKAGATNTNKVGLYRGSILWDFFLRKVKKFSKLNRRLFN